MILMCDKRKCILRTDYEKQTVVLRDDLPQTSVCVTGIEWLVRMTQVTLEGSLTKSTGNIL